MIKNSYMKWAGRAFDPALNTILTTVVSMNTTATPAAKLRRFLRGISAIALVALASTALAAPGPAVLDESHASVRAVIAVQNKVTHEMMKEPEILGTAAGL